MRSKMDSRIEQIEKQSAKNKSNVYSKGMKALKGRLDKGNKVLKKNQL